VALYVGLSACSCLGLYVTLALVLAGIQQHPDLTRRRPGQNARKYPAAPNARVVSFNSRIFCRARAARPQVLVRKLRRRFPVQVSALCAGLNPKVH
jgi:hypothetical protein